MSSPRQPAPGRSRHGSTSPPAPRATSTSSSSTPTTTGGPYDWSLQVEFNSTPRQFRILSPGTYVGNIIYNQWVEVKDIIDLTSGMQSVYYNGAFCETIPWQISGVNEFAALDLFSDGGSEIYWDDFTLQLTGDLATTTWGQIKASLF